jgi:hypothetical protein
LFGRQRGGNRSPDEMMLPNRPIYLLRVQPLKGVDRIVALRALLKSLLREYGMKCLSAEVEKSNDAP